MAFHQRHWLFQGHFALERSLNGPSKRSRRTSKYLDVEQLSMTPERDVHPSPPVDDQMDQSIILSGSRFGVTKRSSTTGGRRTAPPHPRPAPLPLVGANSPSRRPMAKKPMCRADFRRLPVMTRACEPLRRNGLRIRPSHYHDQSFANARTE